MKKRNGLILALAVIASLAIGFLVGIMVEIPKVDDTQVTGTIGKVRNYKNVKITEQDIQIKNELLADSVLLKAIGNYFNYYYVSAVSQGERIRYALVELDPEQEFKEFSGLVLSEFAGYGTFLENARKDLMLAIALCKFPNDAHPVLLRNAITQANNVIAQMSYRKQAVLNLIDNLDTFIGQKGKDVPVVLANVHAVLSCDQIINAVALNDKVVLKYFDKKKLYTTDIKASSLADIQGSSSVLEGLFIPVVHDADVLQQQYESSASIVQACIVVHDYVVHDIDILQMWAASESSLGIDPVILSQENLGFYVQDAALIGSQFCLDAGNLQDFVQSASELGIILDAGSIGTMFQNTADLGMNYIVTDAAGNLSIIPDAIYDQSLGIIYYNSEIIGMSNMLQLMEFMNSTAQLGIMDRQ